MKRIVEGYARKISLILIVISFIGWILFTAGFGYGRENGLLKGVDDVFLSPFWAATVIGPFVHIAAVVHVLLWGIMSSIYGSITAVLSTLYLPFVISGMVYGIFSFAHTEGVLLSLGGVITTLLWTIHLALWPWFRREERHEETAIIRRGELPGSLNAPLELEEINQENVRTTSNEAYSVARRISEVTSQENVETTSNEAYSVARRTSEVTSEHKILPPITDSTQQAPSASSPASAGIYEQIIN